VPELFTRLGGALEGSSLVALAAALAWGVLSVLLSPCHLATIPLIVGFVGGVGAGASRSRALAISVAFASGMFVALGAVGGLVAAAGHALQGARAWAGYLAAALLLAAGLHLLDLLPLPLAGLRPKVGDRKGPLAAFSIGLFLGVGLSPCTFAFLAPILGVAFGAATSHGLFGAALLLAFALGHSAVVAVAGASTGLAQRYLDWSDRSRGATWLKRACGVLLLAGASSLVYSA
jgi:cytochrome c-type biogenesis protein